MAVAGPASPRIIGRGTWLDSLALKIVDREKSLGRPRSRLRVESGLSASGVPHIGNLSDCIRAFAVKLALQNVGEDSEYVAFADDMDGLRSIPAGFPQDLKRFLGWPVNRVPDSFACHTSFAEHTTGLLRDGLDKCGVEYTLMRASEAYGKGLFDAQIERLLSRAEAAGRIIEEEVGQERYRELLPYFPVCGNCNRILSTQATGFLKQERSVSYRCTGRELKKGSLEGCGFQGRARIDKGEGKLSWKVEFAARWSALKINFEAYGKDIADSVRVNDRVMEEILGEPPPYHVRYEMFLDKTGRKVAKSVGNVLTAQEWLRYGSPESLILLMLKRIVGARNVGVEDIVAYERELDGLEDVFFGAKRTSDEKEKAKLRGLYEYVWRLHPPSKPTVHVPHSLLVGLARVAPGKSRVEYVLRKLREYGYAALESDAGIGERIARAVNWALDFKQVAREPVEAKVEEREAVRSLTERLTKLRGEDEVQNAIFETAREHGMEPAGFFRLLYRILFGEPKGPRLGAYIVDVGVENVAGTLGEFLKSR